MPVLETILSLCTPIKSVYDVYKAVTGLIKGDPNTRLLEELVQHNRIISNSMERLSDNILYAPNLHAVQDINHRSNPRKFDGREVREYLEPVQQALKQPILASAMILTPEKMQLAMKKNPWEVLLDVRPLDFFSARLPPEGVPVQFEHAGMRYMGWQSRGALPMLFDCELHDLLDSNAPSIITPSSGIAPSTATSIGQLQVFRDHFRDGGQGPEMVVLPSGEFQMGSKEFDGEQPVHRVRIDYSLAVGRYPVTFAEYDSFCQNRRLVLPKDNNWGRDKRPIINVNWHEANEYCEWLSIQTGRDYRLLSEAEWEYACRAGQSTRFPFGDAESQLSRYAWFEVNSQKMTQPVGEKRPNAWGLYDMLGNVWEWCSDYWHGNYQGAPTDGASWETGGDSKYRTLRGGSWRSLPIGCCAACRYYDAPSGQYNYGGFRVCCLSPVWT